MKTLVFNGDRGRRSLVIGLLLAAFVCSSVFTASGASSRLSGATSNSKETFAAFAVIGSRNFALTTVHGQRHAGELSKQNRTNSAITHAIAASRLLIAPLSSAEQSSSAASFPCLSLRSSRLGGRAPPDPV